MVKYYVVKIDNNIIILKAVCLKSNIIIIMVKFYISVGIPYIGLSIHACQNCFYKKIANDLSFHSRSHNIIVSINNYYNLFVPSKIIN